MGEIVALVVSLLVSEMKTLVLAGCVKLTLNGTVLPGVTVSDEGRTMSAAVLTVTLAVASVKPAALARMVEEPAVTPVTGTLTVVEPAAMLNVAAETVATPVLLEDTLNVSPPVGAGPDRVNVRFLVPVPEIASVDGEKTMLPVTCTD